MAVLCQRPSSVWATRSRSPGWSREADTVFFSGFESLASRRSARGVAAGASGASDSTTGLCPSVTFAFLTRTSTPRTSERNPDSRMVIGSPFFRLAPGGWSWVSGSKWLLAPRAPRRVSPFSAATRARIPRRASRSPAAASISSRSSGDRPDTLDCDLMRAVTARSLPSMTLSMPAIASATERFWSFSAWVSRAACSFSRLAISLAAIFRAMF